MSKQELLVNEGIRAREVRVIGENGEQLGILPIREALQLAAEKAAAEVPAAPVRYLVEAFEAPICDGGGTKYAVIDSKAEHPPGIVHDGPAYKETRDEQVAQGWADELNASTVGGAR